jgi:hypothetical protein
MQKAHLLSSLWAFTFLRAVSFPVALSGAAMAMRKLWDKLHKMTDEELIKFRKDVRRLAENPFQRQLHEARAEFK